jgi:DNA-binding transcriptional regulator LsrR (DeoR family)
LEAGSKKEERDLWVFWLWQSGAVTNGEIGEMFGVSYTAVSHIVNKAKERMKIDRDFQRDYVLFNSQIKM